MVDAFRSSRQEASNVLNGRMIGFEQKSLFSEGLLNKVIPEKFDMFDISIFPGLTNNDSPSDIITIWNDRMFTLQVELLRYTLHLWVRINEKKMLDNLRQEECSTVCVWSILAEGAMDNDVSLGCI